ncbi:hypothetical protein PRIPAC_94970 [Pristionchus pacificus]|nr:hypothetical protein PRIPAC_94970 [Pristionchus pacificus]
MEISSQWQNPSQFPMVFIPITVIDGPWRGPHRIRQSNNVTVTTRGLNSPLGYTSSISGLQVRSSPGLFVAKVPDPELSGLVVEFDISVTDQQNHKCEQFCLNKSGSYKPCIRNSVKISQYPDFSDPILWSKSEAAAVSTEWIGTGYYRRRRITHLMFSCSKSH